MCDVNLFFLSFKDVKIKVKFKNVEIDLKKKWLKVKGVEKA